MNYEEMNEFIQHYTEKDITNSAIMLTGEWGCGKSHYIKNVLKPFLESDNGGNHKCAIVSLYGLKDISEISKCIYVELRLIGKDKKSELKSTAAVAGKIIGKTILNGLASTIGFDIAQSEEDFQKVYESIDLTGKLIIFEDLERSGIDLLQFMGYVNNLTEQDGVKVLLVANEDEILTYIKSEPDKNGQTRQILDDASIKYLRIKEKTVNDTIYFQSDYHAAIKTIIQQYNNKQLNAFTNDDDINDIYTIMVLRRSNNLRSFIFACQKTVDIFERVNKDDYDFNKTIFYSIIAFSMRIKNGSIPDWGGTDLVSTDYGIGIEYPLYRFCYNYIRWQEFDAEDVELTIQAHKKMILYDENESRNDLDLSIVFTYPKHTEQEVVSALLNIEQRLENPEDIPFYNYYKLAYCLIACNTILEFDYKSCKDKMIKNISDKSNEINIDLLLSHNMDFENEDEQNRFLSFVSDLKEAINKRSTYLEFFHMLQMI